MRHLTAIVLMLVVSGCAAGYQKPALDDPYAHFDYQRSLANEYAEYSQSEAEQYDWDAAKLFAHKSTMAREGQDVLPEEPETWGPEAALPELSDARARLMAAIQAPKAKDTHPALLARTQLLFDCWLEQLAEQQPGDMFACRDEFLHSIAQLEKELALPARDASATSENKEKP